MEDVSGGTRELSPGSIDVGPEALSCPSVRLCVIVDHAGGILTSTHPAGGAAAWKRVSVLPGKTIQGAYIGISGISCASVHACVAVSGGGPGKSGGYAVSSSDPTGPASAWRVRRVSSLAGLAGVSCVSASRCVAAGFESVESVTDPTGRAPHWRTQTLEPEIGTGAVTGISCASTAICVTVSGPQVEISRNAQASRPRWTTLSLGGTNTITGISCPSRRLCFAVDNAGHVLSTTTPHGGTRAWKAHRIADTLNGIACPASTLCLAGAESGDVLVSDHPAGPAAGWHAITITPQSSIVSVACASVALCVALDTAGDAISSVDPLGGAAMWHRVHIDSMPVSCDTNECTATLSGLACPASSLCIASDDADNVFTTTDPGAPAAIWRPLAGDGKAISSELTTPSSVSCASVALCAIAEGSRVAVSSDPDAETPNWSTQSLHDAAQLTAVSCAGTACVAVDAAGRALASDTPSRAGSWTRTNADRNVPLTAISCPVTGFCLAGDDEGGVVRGTD